MKQINSSDLHGGLAGVNVDVNGYEFGEGIRLSKTYAHFMAPFLMAFSPAEPGKPHPTPWKAASGGLAYDIHAEVYVPKEFQSPLRLNRVNTLWLFVALLRLHCTSHTFMPIIASHPFASISTLEEEPTFWPFEIYNRRLQLTQADETVITKDSLDWVRKHWLSAAQLMTSNDNFNFAFQAFDQSIWNEKLSLSLVSLWAALESIFSPSPMELKFRLSSAIAVYLEPSGSTRKERFKRIQKLYDARSHAAHGIRVTSDEPVRETYELTRRVLTKIIEENKVPDQEYIEDRFFGKK